MLSDTDRRRRPTALSGYYDSPVTIHREESILKCLVTLRTRAGVAAPVARGTSR